MLALAYLTYIQWLLKVKLFFMVLDHHGTFYEFFKETKDHQNIWLWKVTVSRSNEPTPTFLKKSDKFHYRSLLCITRHILWYLIFQDNAHWKLIKNTFLLDSTHGYKQGNFTEEEKVCPAKLLMDFTNHLEVMREHIFEKIDVSLSACSLCKHTWYMAALCKLQSSWIIRVILKFVNIKKDLGFFPYQSAHRKMIS